MILQALYDYYDRKARDPDEALAPPGFEPKEIHLVIVLDQEGKSILVEDMREGTGRQRRGRTFLVPQAPKKSVNIAASLLWGNSEYILGSANPTKLEEQRKKGNEQRYRQRLLEMHNAFCERIAILPQGAKEDDGVQAVTRFLEGEGPPALLQSERWRELAQGSENISFRLSTDNGLICERPAVTQVILSAGADAEATVGRCLVTGNQGAVERLHPSIRGVRGAKTTGANIVSFNLKAFESLGKEQGSNAPVSKQAAFAYTTALNHLLSKDSKQKTLVGDATVVFWAEKAVPMESLLEDLFGEPPKDDPDRMTQAVRALYEAPASGDASLGDNKTRFFVLGLSPNGPRLSVRFWVVTTVGDLAANIRLHFNDLRVVHGPREPDTLSVFRLLVNLASQGKADNIPPNLAGEVMRSILAGTPYPRTLLSSAVGRSRAEQSKDHGPVPYARAAILKACLNREIRAGRIEGKEVTVGLDLSNENVGYRLGRLFAVLEKAQEEANPGINATIRDRYYGAASSTPASVFPTLMRLKNHHIAKLENRGRAVNLERLIGEVVDPVKDFLPVLCLPDQGRFALGYYHQRQKFFEKADNSSKGA